MSILEIVLYIVSGLALTGYIVFLVIKMKTGKQKKVKKGNQDYDEETEEKEE